MEEQFVTYPLSLRLKEIGFGINCMAYYFIGGRINNYFNKFYNNNKLSVTQPYKFHCAAPLWQQALDWFEKYDFHAHYDLKEKTHLGNNYYYKIVNATDLIDESTTIIKDGFKTKREAKEACLEHLIKLVESFK